MPEITIRPQYGIQFDERPVEGIQNYTEARMRDGEPKQQKRFKVIKAIV